MTPERRGADQNGAVLGGAVRVGEAANSNGLGPGVQSQPTWRTSACTVGVRPSGMRLHHPVAAPAPGGRTKSKFVEPLQSVLDRCWRKATIGQGANFGCGQPTSEAGSERMRPPNATTLFFAPPPTQKEHLACPSIGSRLRLDIGQIDAPSLHQKLHSGSDDQEWRKVDDQRLKRAHWLAPIRPR